MAAQAFRIDVIYYVSLLVLWVGSISLETWASYSKTRPGVYDGNGEGKHQRLRQELGYNFYSNNIGTHPPPPTRWRQNHTTTHRTTSPTL